MENAWLSWAKRLQSVASTGLHYSRVECDRERYDEVAAIANEMLSTLGSVPINRIQGLVSDFAKGYATPKVDIAAAFAFKSDPQSIALFDCASDSGTAENGKVLVNIAIGAVGNGILGDA